MRNRTKSTLSVVKGRRNHFLAAAVWSTAFSRTIGLRILAIIVAFSCLPIRGNGRSAGQPSTLKLQPATLARLGADESIQLSRQQMDRRGRYSPGRPWVPENGLPSADSAAEAPSDAMAPPPFFVTAFGTAASGNGQFLFPTGVALDRSGNVYVSDNGNGRIQKFNSSGAFLAAWGSQGSGDGQFEFPIGVAIDAAEDVYVTDYEDGRVQKFDRNGTFLMKFGSLGSGDGQFVHPGQLAVDGAANVYVLDLSGHKVLKSILPATSSRNGAGWGRPPASYSFPAASPSTHQGAFLSPTSSITGFRSSIPTATSWA